MESLIGGTQIPIVGRDDKGAVRLKVTVTVVEINDSMIALPGQPLPPQIPKDQKFLALYPLPSPQGFQMVVVAGSTKENAIKGMTQALQQNLGQNQLLGLEEVEIDVQPRSSLLGG